MSEWGHLIILGTLCLYFPGFCCDLSLPLSVTWFRFISIYSFHILSHVLCHTFYFSICFMVFITFVKCQCLPKPGTCYWRMTWPTWAPKEILRCSPVQSMSCHVTPEQGFPAPLFKSCHVTSILWGVSRATALLFSVAEEGCWGMCPVPDDDCQFAFLFMFLIPEKSCSSSCFLSLGRFVGTVPLCVSYHWEGSRRQLIFMSFSWDCNGASLFRCKDLDSVLVCFCSDTPLVPL